MPWIGNCVPIPGGFSGFEGVILKVRDFTTAANITGVVWRVNDPPVGGTVKIRLHNQADGLGSYLEATILDGTRYIAASGLLPITNGVWQQIIAPVDALAMNLSGEYMVDSATGIADYFTTLAKVKLDAKISGTDVDRDAVIESMIAGVTRRMQDWMGRDIVQGTATNEKHDGYPCGGPIQTKHYPIRTITSLTENGIALTENVSFESVARDRDLGQIYRIASGPAAWSEGRRNIVVTYEHGYVTVPEALCEAATSLVVVKFFETVQSGKAWRGLTSKGVEPNAATSYDKALWIRETIPAMEPYRKAIC